MPKVAYVILQAVGRSYSFIADILGGAVPPHVMLINADVITEETFVKALMKAWHLPEGAENFTVSMQTAVCSEVDEGEEEAELHNLTTVMLADNGETALRVNLNEDIPDAIYPVNLWPLDNCALGLGAAVDLIKESIASTNSVGALEFVCHT